MTNELEAFEETENKAFADYIEDFKNEQIVTESAKSPIEFKSNGIVQEEEKSERCRKALLALKNAIYHFILSDRSERSMPKLKEILFQGIERQKKNK